MLSKTTLVAHYTNQDEFALHAFICLFVANTALKSGTQEKISFHLLLSCAYMNRTFKSKIGPELVIPITLLMGTLLFVMINGKPAWLGIAILLCVIGFIIHMFITTNYTIDGNSLIIKCGILLNKTIDIKGIKKITETNNPLSAPAISLDRLEISYGSYDSILISPKQKKEFIETIVSLNPQVEIRYKKK